MKTVKLGMIFFLVSEAMFFLMLIIAYVALHHASSGSAQAERTLDPAKTAVFTALLLASSFTIWLSERGNAAGKHFLARGWLAMTLLLGGIFLFGQGREYAHMLSSHVTISSSLFATTFFTLTGFHGLHVFVGLLAMSVVLGLHFSPAFTGLRGSALPAVALYWHFVDAVWIAVFSVVYLRVL